MGWLDEISSILLDPLIDPAAKLLQGDLSGVSDLSRTVANNMLPGLGLGDYWANSVESFLSPQALPGGSGLLEALPGSSGTSSMPALSSGGNMLLPMVSGPANAVIPFTGQNWPGPGYRLSMLPARRPSAGRPAGMYWKKPRRTNPLNPQALMRAERRMSMFTRWVKKHFSVMKSMPRRKKSRRRK